MYLGLEIYSLDLASSTVNNLYGNKRAAIDAQIPRGYLQLVFKFPRRIQLSVITVALCAALRGLPPSRPIGFVSLDSPQHIRRDSRLRTTHSPNHANCACLQLPDSAVLIRLRASFTALSLSPASSSSSFSPFPSPFLPPSSSSTRVIDNNFRAFRARSESTISHTLQL